MNFGQLKELFVSLLTLDFWHFLEIFTLFQNFQQITDIIIKENTQQKKEGEGGDFRFLYGKNFNRALHLAQLVLEDPYVS